MSDETEIRIHVNGEETTVPLRATVAQLVEARGLRTGQVAVELNKAVIPRAAHGSTQLEAGDRVEIVTLVGGG